ncbi:hypothetical protein C8R45DRAFT_1174560 [Mycena sanguinolenta]|nr:hypothetical protein C8R45DRAFT_1174560 [Mycena sanguinolenta]
MTVVMYEGDGAEEAWKQHLAKYEAIRHPNIMQLYGLVSSQRLRGMVFHDELIPYAQFLRRFEHSPFLSAYIVGYCDATNYISDDSITAWIRPLTGELCLELAPESVSGPWRDSREFRILRVENVFLDAPDSEDIIISSLSENQYHELCSVAPIAHFQSSLDSTQHPVGPGIFRSDLQRGTYARLTEPLILPEEECYWDLDEGAPGELKFVDSAWLAQANHIFAELEEEAHAEAYVCIYEVTFLLQVAQKPHIPEGYLFVCPPQDFRISTESHANLYQWPDCPAYWSLDPSGADRLNTEDARILGFPEIHIEDSRLPLVGRPGITAFMKGCENFTRRQGVRSGESGGREAAGIPAVSGVEWSGFRNAVSGS